MIKLLYIVIFIGCSEPINLPQTNSLSNFSFVHYGQQNDCGRLYSDQNENEDRIIRPKNNLKSVANSRTYFSRAPENDLIPESKLNTNEFNRSTQCAGLNSGLPNRYRKSRYLGYPRKSSFVITLTLLKGTAFMMGLNSLHEADILFPLPRSLFAFEYETMHGPIRPKGKPPNQPISQRETYLNTNRIWSSQKQQSQSYPGRVHYYEGVPSSHQTFYRARSMNERHIVLSQLESALDTFGLDGKNCISHLICMMRLSQSTDTLLHEITELLLKRNIPRSYNVKHLNCEMYECPGILQGLAKYLSGSLVMKTS